MRKSALFPAQGKPPAAGPPLRPAYPTHRNTEHHMDAERINQIGTLLEDLSTRTVDLRRYL